MSAFRTRTRRRGHDVIELLAASRPASLEPPQRSLAEARARAADITVTCPGGYHPAYQARRSRSAMRFTLLSAGVALTAAGTAVAIVLPAIPPAGPANRPRAISRPHPLTRPTQHLTARKILLTAAAHVANGPVTGKYWRVQMIGGLLVPAGTKAHPYDISLRTYADQWNPRSAGQRFWQITSQLGARPASPADAAAWVAAGSPTSWHSGRQPVLYPGGYPVQWNDPLAATTAASSRSASWQVSNGTVGFVEGDLAGLTAGQFRRMPTGPRQIKALLRRYARKAHCHYAGCSTVDQLTWAEAIMLLQDPVSAPVRSATFKVMAGLPGVRLIGPMTDPLGRRGYAITPGSQYPNADPRNFNPIDVFMIDPHTGTLLATAEIAPMPRTVHCLAFNAGNKCVGSSYIGRSYPGQIDDYVAVISEGWTNSSPQLPPAAARSAKGCCAGLPPLP
jgi:hypothetical protein